MAEKDKKYYWLKFNKGFFKRHDIKIIEAVKPNGKEYVLFYLKLLLESIDHEGCLRFSDALPYDYDMLSVVTETEIDIVTPAMELFIKFGMVEILDDETIYMTGISKLIGSETSTAIRKRKSREKQAQSNECDNVTKMSQKCHTEIDKEKDKEKDLEQEDGFATKPKRKPKSNNPFLNELMEGEME